METIEEILNGHEKVLIRMTSYGNEKENVRYWYKRVRSTLKSANFDRLKRGIWLSKEDIEKLDNKFRNKRFLEAINQSVESMEFGQLKKIPYKWLVEQKKAMKFIIGWVGENIKHNIDPYEPRTETEYVRKGNFHFKENIYKFHFESIMIEKGKYDFKLNISRNAVSVGKESLFYAFSWKNYEFGKEFEENKFYSILELFDDEQLQEDLGNIDPELASQEFYRFLVKQFTLMDIKITIPMMTN